MKERKLFIFSFVCLLFSNAEAYGTGWNFRTWSGSSVTSDNVIFSGGTFSIPSNGTLLQDSAGSMWNFQVPISLANMTSGFQVAFNFRFERVGVNTPGNGIIFGLQSDSTRTGSGDLGFADLTKGFGIAFKQPTAKVLFLSTNDNVGNIVTGQTQTAFPFDELVHAVAIHYDVLLSTPTLFVYVDNILLLKVGMTISNFLISNQPIYAGWTAAVSGSSGVTMRHQLTTGTVPQQNNAWDFIMFNPNDYFYFTAAQINMLYIHNGNITTSLYPFSSFWTGVNGFYTLSSIGRDSLVVDEGPAAKVPPIPNGCVAIVASNVGGLLGFRFEIRNSIGRTIDLTGEWKCWGGAPASLSANWYLSSFNNQSLSDPLWETATVISGNDEDLLGSANYYRRQPGLTTTTQLLWRSNDSTVYCRAIIPRYCTPTNSTFCRGGETCNNQTNLCTCGMPFRRTTHSSVDTCSAYVVPNITNISPLYGNTAGGINVTVTGFNFYTNTSAFRCFFGATQATLISVSPTVAVCRLPPGVPGTIGLTVRNVASASASASQSVTFTYYATFTIDSLSPNATSSAGSVLVTLQGTGFANGLPYFCSFADSVVVPATFLSTTRLSIVTPPFRFGIYTISCTVNFVNT